LALRAARMRARCCSSPGSSRLCAWILGRARRPADGADRLADGADVPADGATCRAAHGALVAPSFEGAGVGTFEQWISNLRGEWGSVRDDAGVLTSWTIGRDGHDACGGHLQPQHMKH